MRSIYSVITRRFFKQSLIPILLVEVSLIITLFLLNNYQSKTNKEALQSMTRESFKEIATQTSEVITQRFAYDKSSLVQIKQTAEIFLEHLNEFPVDPNEWHYVSGFYQYNTRARGAEGFSPLPASETTTVYTKNLEQLKDEDYKTLTAMTLLVPSIEATVETQNDLISAAWINIGKHYALAYPPITPEKELSSTLDVTTFPFYYLADPEHNPGREAVFIPLYFEEWGIRAGELGAYLIPVYKNDRFLGVIGLTLTGKAVADVIQAMELPFHANALLLDADERLIASSNPDTSYDAFGVRSFYEQYQHPEYGENSLKSIDMANGALQNAIVFKQPIPDTGMRLIIYADRDDIFETVNYISSRTVTVGIAFVSAIALFYFIFFWFSVKAMKRLAQTIASPLRSIVDFSYKLGRDEGVALEPSTINELEELNINLNRTHNKLLQMVIKDETTGLYNRRKLFEDLKECTTAGSLMLFQLSNYKTLHNLYGKEAADALVLGVVEELNSAGDLFVYRIGDDDFAVLHFRDDPQPLKTLFNAITAKHITFHSIDIHPFIFAGIANEPQAAIPLFEQAGMALLHAQRSIASQPVHYRNAHTIKEAFEANLSWSSRLNHALREDRLIPYFQPIYNLHSDRIEKFESLVRLVENGNVISPGHFLPSAASMGKLHDITRLMLQKVFAVARQHPEMGFSVNVSVKDLDDPHFLSYVRHLCHRHSVQPHRITFELLETDAIENSEHTVDVITELKQAGFSIAIDDFGTGHSNFAQLMMMRVDYIKIDGQFIKHITKDPNSATITKTITKFAKLVGAKTVAEFVSDQAVLKRVCQFEIDYAQGYAISEPVPADKIAALLQKR